MCDHCVIETVKQSMLSRRDLFRASAATLAVAASAAPPALAAGHGRVIDLSHVVSSSFPTYFGDPLMTVEPVVTFEKDGYNGNRVEHFEHVGTHVDAPIHFSTDGRTAEELQVGELVAPLCVVDIREKAAADPDAQVTPDDLKAWIASHGDIPPGACVAMNSGWAARASGEAFRNADGEGKMHFPGFHPEAAKMLIEESWAIGMAVDTLSLDHGVSADFATHLTWLPSNRWGLECVANLDAAPAAGATVVVGLPKVAGGTGGPARVIALV